MKWVKYLGRSNDLFTASLWYNWYSSNYWTSTFNLNKPKAYMIQDTNGIVHWFWDKDEFENYSKAKIKHFTSSKEISKNLKMAYKLNRISMDMKFNSLESASDHLNKLAFYSTIYPFILIQTYEKLGIKDENLKMAEKLRMVSLYPEFIEKKIIPFVENHPKYPDITINNTDIKKTGEYFTLSYYPESVKWNNDPSLLLSELLDIAGEIKGMPAYPGIVKGHVKIVNNVKDMEKVEENDIIVTVNSNPTIIPSIRKASAIISDEGGMTCHASIISRELKKPCIVGTKNATIALKDGDLVEVDAIKGVVRKIE